MSLLANISSLVERTPEAGADWHATEPWVRFGVRTVTYLCGGLVAVSLLFDISGAVVASGSVSVEGEYKAVQHLEGGIVTKILVRNGDRVAQGQPVIEMDQTQARANLAATDAKIMEYSIQEARLIAERDRKESFAAPDTVDISDPEAAKSLAAQTSLFNTRRIAFLGQQKVLIQRITQAESDLAGTASQLAARTKERDINRQELETVRPLFEQGYVNQQRIGPLEREAARITGDIGNLKAETTKARAARAENEARLAQTEKEYSQQAAEELQKIQPALAEAREVRKAYADRVSRAIVLSPAAGYIHAIAVHTSGGVVQPGATLMQIIPDDRELVVQVRLQPRDIDSVHVGQPATVRFSAFDTRTTPRLSGRVRSVSAAEIVDNQGKSYFTAEVEVPKSELAKLETGERLLPGMPAELFLETHSRSILSYFLKPLEDMLAGAFRER